MLKNESSGDKAMIIVCYILLLALAGTILFPVINLVAVSTSGLVPTMSGKVTLLPEEFHLEAYKYILSSFQFLNSLKVSIFVTVVGSVLSVICSVLVAYPLSKKNLPGRKWLLLLFVFTMMFSGGIIPSYILMQKMRLINSIWVLILPNLVSVYNLLIVKNYFEGMPEAIEESAKIDGAGSLRILISIVLPMAIPVLATIFMFFTVSYWNSYFNAKMYITQRELMPIQQYLQLVIFEATDPTGEARLSASSGPGMAPQTIINATVVCAMLPMVLLYPSLQRFFEKGTTIGSVKG